MNVPEDCVVVKALPNVKGTHSGTWHINEGETKTIPIDIYLVITDKLELVEDPNYLVSPNPASMPTPQPKEPVDLEKATTEAKDLMEKVKNIGKKNKK